MEDNENWRLRSGENNENVFRKHSSAFCVFAPYSSLSDHVPAHSCVNHTPHPNSPIGKCLHAPQMRMRPLCLTQLAVSCFSCSWFQKCLWVFADISRCGLVSWNNGFSLLADILAFFSGFLECYFLLLILMSSPPRVLPEFFKVYLPEYSSDRLVISSLWYPFCMRKYSTFSRSRFSVFPFLFWALERLSMVCLICEVCSFECWKTWWLYPCEVDWL